MRDTMDTVEGSTALITAATSMPAPDTAETGCASTGAAVRITVSSPERPATYPPAAPATTAARVNPAAAANRCGRRRPRWERPAGAAGAVGGADECDQGGEEGAPAAWRGGPEGPVADPVGGDNGARPVGGRRGGCGCWGRSGSSTRPSVSPHRQMSE